MKYTVKIFFYVLLVTVFSQSCNTFEAEPLDRRIDEDVWASGDFTGTLLRQYHNGIYFFLPELHNRINNDYLDSGTDDAMPTEAKNSISNVNAFRNGGLSTNNLVDGAAWGRNYEGIRRANVFLTNVDRADLDDDMSAMVPTWKAEARFLRAFYYFELIKRWGGVPLLYDRVFTTECDMNVPRNTLQECADYILNELNDVENQLYASRGLAAGNFGRATNGAAMALRVRLLLYMASELNNPTGDLTKWQAAADEAKKLIDLDAYALHSGFREQFFTLIDNREIILARVAGQGTGVAINNSPVGYQSLSYACRGLTSPSRNLVDAFLTIDGKRIEDCDDYDEQNPYANRDPRLRFTVFHNNSRWLGRAVQTFEGGLDKPNSASPQTRTGYYMRKFMNNREEEGSFSSAHQSFIIFRYGEVLLNYAEALNEYAHLDPAAQEEVRDALIQLRRRAGINAGDDGLYGLPDVYEQAQMREIIRNERRIELAFEEHRFFDIRRWKIAEDVMNKPLKGTRITRLADGSFTYQVIDVVQQSFDPTKMYLYPVSFGEMTGNKAMVQNPGWNF